MHYQIPEAEIRALWERGLSVNRIAKALGVSFATIKWRVDAMDLPARPAIRCDERLLRLTEAWAAGLSVPQIAQELGICAESVRLWARDFELPARAAEVVRKAPFDLDVLRGFWGQGLSVRQIAARLGVSHPTVYAWAARLQLPVPNPACAVAGSPAARVRGAAQSVLGEVHEARVLAGLRRGLSRRTIADDLGVSEATLRRFIARHQLAVAADPVAEPDPVPEPAPAPRLPRVRIASVPVAAAPAAATAPDLPPFDADLAKALTWSDLRTIAARHGKPLSLAQSRWHRLRGQVAA
jgi:transposase